MRTRRRHTRTLLAAIAAAIIGTTGLVAGPSAAPAQAVSTLDQSADRLTTPGQYVPVTSNGFVQTFTAGKTGAIDRLSLVYSTGPSAEVRAEVVTLVDGSVSGGRTLGYTTLPALTSNSDQENFRTASFDYPAPVVAGTQYGLVLRSTSVAWLRIVTGYEGGRLATHPENISIAFQTHVDDELQAPVLTAGDADFTVGSYATARFSATGSPAPTVFVSGSLPPGLTYTSAPDGAMLVEGAASRAGAYPITVMASNGIGPAVSRTVTLNVAAVAPSHPLDLEAKSLPDGRITASWQPPSTDGGAPITEYSFATSTGAGCTTTTLSCTFDGSSLSPGSTSPVRLTAKNSAGHSSEPLFGSLTYLTAPSSVRNLTASADDRTVSLAWNAPLTDGGAAVSEYAVEQRSPGGDWSPVPDYAGTARQTTVAGLDNGGAYDFRVAARNAPQGWGPWTEISATPASAPGGPVNLRAMPGDGQITLQWDEPLNTGGSPVTGYRIQERTLMGPWVDRASPTERTLTLTGLTNGQTHRFRVAAVNAIGHGPWAEFADATPRTVPSAPRNLAATPGDRQIVVSWEGPASDGGSAIMSYRVTATPVSGDDPVTATLLAGTRSHTFTGLENGGLYRVQVFALNGMGEGPGSAPIARTPFLFAPRFTGPDGSPLSGSTLHRGDAVELTGADLPVDATVTVKLHSTPVELGTARVGADGTVTVSATLPSDAAYGEHDIVAHLTRTGAEPVSISVPVTIAASAPGPSGPGGPAPESPAPRSRGQQGLVATGSELTGLATASALLLLAGLGAARLGLRGRRRS